MKAFYALTGFGHEAVIVFFVISGLLVGGHSLEKLRNSQLTEIEYIVNRAARDSHCTNSCNCGRLYT